MNKKVLVCVITLIVVLGLGGFLIFHKQNNGPSEAVRVAFDPLNATYMIEGRAVAMKNGLSEVIEVVGDSKTAGATMKTTTRVFGEPVQGDLNGDGVADAALFIVQDTGGTGTFYYAAAALNERTGAVGTNAIFLGDRIAPQTIEIRNGQVIANYAERGPNEPFSTQPSIGVSKYLVVNGITLTEK